MPDQRVSPDRFPIKARVRRGVGVLLLAAVAGCAGPAPQPVAVVQPQDRYADCPAIYAEVQANNKKIQDLARRCRTCLPLPARGSGGAIDPRSVGRLSSTGVNPV